MSRPFELGRYEMKYVLPTSQRDRVLEIAQANIKPDMHAQDVSKSLGDALGREPVDGARGYVVHSLYLDTPTLDDYTERLEDARIRRRFRIRTYGAHGQRQPVYLEAKRKWEDRVIKQRTRISDADTWGSYPEPRPWTRLAAEMEGPYGPGARRFAEVADSLGMVPVSCVHYVREVYVDPAPGGEKTRLTLDYGITATVKPSALDLYGADDIGLIPNTFTVLELKFDGSMPGWMRGLVTRLGLRAESVSKFGLSVAMGVRAGHFDEIRKLTPVTVLREAA
jgi:hypothetical protein